MAPKFKIEFHSGEVMEAGSFSALLSLLAHEKEKWQKIIPGHSIVQRGVTAVDAKYDVAISFVESYKWSESGGINSVRLEKGSQIFPLFESAVGLRIREFLKLELKMEAISLICYWQLINQWRDRSEMQSDQSRGTFARLGASMYWSIISHESVISRINSIRNLTSEQERLLDAMSSLEHDIYSAKENKAQFDSFMIEGRVKISQKLAQINRVALMGVGKVKRRQSEWEDKFEKTHNHFIHKLQYEAPVTLWKRTEETHQGRAATAISWFVAILIFTVLGCGIIIIYFGDDIAATFYRMRCASKNDCVEVFSAKGPLTVGSLLLAASLAIWGLRFSSKLYLSERHLAIGAAERKAFTESYLALVSDQVVTREQEAIVLAALFRPSSDGVIKDDDGGLDISAATILAKALSGPVAKP